MVLKKFFFSFVRASFIRYFMPFFTLNNVQTISGRRIRQRQVIEVITMCSFRRCYYSIAIHISRTFALFGKLLHFVVPELVFLTFFVPSFLIKLERLCAKATLFITLANLHIGCKETTGNYLSTACMLAIVGGIR